MSKYLVIVESPTKAKTILTILGKDYEVASSKGHVADLPAKKLAVDVNNDFAPHYEVIPGKKKIISQLKKQAKGKEIIYLATDPDREGEAISWHIKEALSKIAKTFYRVTFHEITKEAVEEAFANPTELDINKVNAQTARRVLDRIVGYNLSPLLWKKIVRGLSAGRVQSVALKFIVDREKEIGSFLPQTTYTIDSVFKRGNDEFNAKLNKYRGKKAVFETKEEAQKCIDQIKNESFLVNEIIKRKTEKKPPAPFTTSLLQQDAFNKLRFSSNKTMFVAQKLYEGVSIDDTMTGLITYMRTDSFSISPRAKKEIAEFIQHKFGSNYLPEKEHQYKEKKGAQLAHEAIRPTSILREPEQMENFLVPEEMKLYRLIWKRTLSSFMKEAVYENSRVSLVSQTAEFIAEDKKLIFEGYLKLYEKEEDGKILPDLKQNDPVTFCDCKIAEHITKPPAHFNDASLVRLLEEKGIGRPSTYAPTISTLIMRNYIKRQKGYFVPTDLGIKVSNLLVEYFPETINQDFTARMEDQLDNVEEGKAEWEKILKDFYPSFKDKVDRAGESIKKEVERTDKICPQCAGALVVKWSRKGRFLSCENFPKCRYGESITTDVTCPGCKEGKLIERRNKRGQFFYGCSKFPNCKYTSRTLPEQETPEQETPEQETPAQETPEQENPIA